MLRSRSKVPQNSLDRVINATKEAEVQQDDHVQAQDTRLKVSDLQGEIQQWKIKARMLGSDLRRLGWNDVENCRRVRDGHVTKRDGRNAVGLFSEC